MKKIPTIFKRNPENRSEILDEPHDDCEWVFAGEGVPTRKYDGTCCMIKDGTLWKRREIKKGQDQPPGYVPVDHDNVTGKTVGWVPVLNIKDDKWHLEAYSNYAWNLPDGTYELCGPKIQGNPEGFERHVLVSHSNATQYDNVPRTFEGLRGFLNIMDIEGLVVHHEDGRMAKIKKRDYKQPRTHS